MAASKKIDIPLEKLVAIALAINENTISNKNRSKEEKIPTDKFIRQFGINRKDFSETIKDIEIKYNPSTFLYDIYESLLSNNKVTTLDISQVEDDKQQSNYKVTTIKKIDKTPTTNLETIPEELKKVMLLSNELEEMVYWYRKHKDDGLIIDVPEININHSDLEGELTVRSFKTYTRVLDKFADYCKGKKEMQKDLVALALVELMDKYK